jgi:hypothetical protein
LENRRNGEAELDSEYEEEIEVEHNDEEGDPIVRLISFLSNIGSARVEFSCYDGSLRDETLIDWTGELERYFEYENVYDPNCFFFFFHYKVKRTCCTLVGYVVERHRG